MGRNYVAVTATLDEIIEDIRMVASGIGAKRLSMPVYRAYGGKYWRSTILRLTGKQWNEIVVLAGLDVTILGVHCREPVARRPCRICGTATYWWLRTGKTTCGWCRYSQEHRPGLRIDRGTKQKRAV